MRTFLTSGLLAAVLVTATDVGGQEAASRALAMGPVPVTLTLGAGTSRLAGGGDLFHLLRNTLGLSASDFDSGVIEIELAAALGARTDVLIGGGIRKARSVVTGAWENTGGFVTTEQATRLSVTPGVHVGGRLFAFEREGSGAGRTARTANPFMMIGVGRGSYSLRQIGQFVDDGTHEGFEASFAATDGYFRGFLGVGVDFALTPGLSVTMEGRRDYASPTPGDDFRGFDDLDLSGSTLTFGLRWR